ncbi:hypothetical protein P152DRAFT_516934 [Eremomyces bilateralis CBS 781.70]|uniref:Mus7/MMS22 family-domain-containing protein n=1 Tax=Eremomyces bilateralis CBS 781.70 TaxID=1392243 RepID=A0A6G1FTV5_9PEZI|nr:uncharacterized protein P152DRAFT_516934 [Eremomyces bilateralis CBS 781.70]KAF1809109.1 hypothetical protein P152DRAFT_516934 [Eremomyces bilateralis CBS 781.70]
MEHNAPSTFSPPEVTVFGNACGDCTAEVDGVALVSWLLSERLLNIGSKVYTPTNLITGIVPDSEEEDDSLDESRNPISGLAIDSHGSQLLVGLEKDDHHDPVPHGPTRSPNPPGTPSIHSDRGVRGSGEDHCSQKSTLTTASSALTVLSQTPDTSPFTNLHPGPSTPPRAPLNSNTLHQTSESGPDIRLFTRNLRTRKDRQLFPYTSEYLEFNRRIKNSGIPIAELGPAARRAYDAHRHKENAAIEPQNTETQSSEREYGENGEECRSSPIRASPLPDSGRTEPTTPKVIESDEESVPDLSIVVRRNGNKRLKLATSSTRRRNRSEANSRPGPSPSTPQDIFDIPDSSPSARSASPAEAPRFRMPKGFQNGIPTPTAKKPAGAVPHPTSTRAKSHHRSVAQGADQIDGRREAAQTPLLAISSDDDSDKSASAEQSLPGNESEDHSQLRQVTRRIKGVLPASWVRLDRQAQDSRQKSKQDLHLKSTQRPGPGKGIAVRVNRSPFRSEAQDAQLTLFSDSESSIATSSRNNTPPIRTNPTPTGSKEQPLPAADDTETFDDLENEPHDDSFFYEEPIRDAPSAWNNRMSHQPKITEAFSRPVRSPRGLIRESNNYATNQPKRRNADKHRMPQPRRPSKSVQLSILDVEPTEMMNSTGEIPHFLRLSLREAKKRPDHGRHSPGSKHIRLQNATDTADAQDTLTRWRTRSISHRPLPGRMPSGATPGHLATRAPFQRQSKLPSPIPFGPQSHEGSKRPRLKSGHRQLLLPEYPLSNPPSTEQLNADEPEEASPKQKRRSTTLQNRSHKPIARSKYRNAQLEAVESEYNYSHQSTAFQKGLQRVNTQFLRSKDAEQRNRIGLHLQTRTLGFNSSHRHGPPISTIIVRETNSEPGVTPHPSPNISRPRRRKVTPSRVEVDLREYRQPSEPLPVDSIVEDQYTRSQDDTNSLYGLQPYGARYPVTFDMSLLPSDTYFHDSTFIGSGDLRLALDARSRDFDHRRGTMTIRFASQEFHFGPWNEETSSQLTDIFQRCGTLVQSASQCDDPATPMSEVILVLRSLIKHFASFLTFVDPIDRENFSSKLQYSLKPFLEVIREAASTPNSLSIFVTALLRAITYTIILLHISVFACSSGELARQPTQDLKLLRDEVTKASFSLIIRCSMPQIRAFLEDSKRRESREAGIRNDQAAIEAVVVLYWVYHRPLSEKDANQDMFWSQFNLAVDCTPSSITNVAEFDRLWYSMFTLLPLVQFDSGGIPRTPGQHSGANNWGLVKLLLGRLIELYPPTSQKVGTTLNEYVRAVLSRCLVLLTQWGWHRCELILGMIFDFFAKRGLSFLRKEDGHSSPRFLDDRLQTYELKPSLDDKSFHIFLKMLWFNTHWLTANLEPKKVLNIVYRFIPNHGREYPKEKAMLQSDLDALRNHHDLLCTLYLCSPTGYRLKLDWIWQLVDFSSSHIQACQVNVRTWARIARGLLEQRSEVICLKELATRFESIVSAMVSQYHLARTEAESVYDDSQGSHEGMVSEAVLRATIISNQTTVCSVLTNAMVGLRDAAICGKEPADIAPLLDSSVFDLVFPLCRSTTYVPRATLMETLRVVYAFVELINRQRTESTQSQGTDATQNTIMSSQADRSAIPRQNPPSLCENVEIVVLQRIENSLARLLSDSFGADLPPEDEFVAYLVEVWVLLASSTVSLGIHDWSYYINSYNPGSFSLLADKSPKRRFGPLLLAKIIFLYPAAYTEHREFFLTAWLVSLAEREALVKYQNIFTTAILNVALDDTLVDNLPVCRNPQRDSFEISPAELKERRMAIISSVFSNMRKHYDHSKRSGSFPDVQKEYVSMLQPLLTAMKSYSFELHPYGTTGPTPLPNRGRYVEFIQTLLLNWQQYVDVILPFDQFFTNNPAFPQPDSDPAYVAAKIMSLGLAVTDIRTAKELVSFVLNLIDPTAPEETRSLLVIQLVKATLDGHGEIDKTTPTLLSLFVYSIFPPYIEVSLGSPSPSILATPMLEAASLLFQGLLTRLNVCNSESRKSGVQLITSILTTIQTAMMALMRDCSILREVSVLRSLELHARVIISTLAPLDYLQRRQNVITASTHAIWDLVSVFLDIAKVLLGQEEVIGSMINLKRAKVDNYFLAIRSYCGDQIGRHLKSCWRNEGNKAYTLQGRKWVNVERIFIIH